YNRDGKKGKSQIVIGLLCDETGTPLSIEVFEGNTQDQATFASQIRKAAQRFGGGEITFVGDRGMIKSKQVEDLVDHYGFHYITAITKPQIEKLLAQEVIQMSLFDQELAEVQTDEGIRYVLRRNPFRAQEVQASREGKFQSLQLEVSKQNQRLAEHPRARMDVSLRKVRERCKTLKLSEWVTPLSSEREISLTVNEEILSETAKLDGCYVLKTDIKKEIVSKEIIHTRYKDLALVEWAFRTSKTVELEMRPVYVRLASRTRGHVFVIMLAYLIVQELAKRWCNMDLTVEEGIKELTTLCVTEIFVNKGTRCNKIPQPRMSVQQLLQAAQVRLPTVLPCKGINVATRKKLTKNRKTD
ncbi:MAG: IS1634 family transposase, partial [bacterium]|nr:IS1634 family transposase [bacterium]